MISIPFIYLYNNTYPIVYSYTNIAAYDPSLISDNNLVFNICYFSTWEPYNFINSPVTKMVEYIQINKKPDTKIIFENPRDSIDIDETLNKIYEVVELSGIDYRQFYFLTCCLQIEEIFNQWLIKSGKNYKINIIAVNHWESHNKFNFGEPLPAPIEYQIRPKSKKFLFLNRIARSHRFVSVMMASKLDLLTHGYYSFLNLNSKGISMEPVDESFYAELLSEFKNDNLIQQVRSEYDRIKNTLPWFLNIQDLTNNQFWPTTRWRQLKSDDVVYYQDSYFSVISERVFFNNTLLDEGWTHFLTEKVFRPVYLKHPFIFLSWPGSLKHMRDLGYQTFNGLIDETYDTIENDTDRLLAVLAEIQRLCSFTESEFLSWQQQIKPIVEHNFSVLQNKTSPQDSIFKRINAGPV